MIIRADCVLTMSGQDFAPGAVRVSSGRIAAVGAPHDISSSPGEDIISLGATVLTPGLINAHCHLEYTGFRGRVPKGESFTSWVRDVIALKRQFTTADYARATLQGFALLRDSGTTTVGNIEAFPELLSQLDPPPLRTWWFLELIDVNGRAYDEASLIALLSVFDHKPAWLGGAGFSPHAPYTASIELYRRVANLSEQRRIPFTTHVAESADEDEMFANARGPLFEWLQRLGRDCSDCARGSAAELLIENGLLSSNCILVHCNYGRAADFDALAASGTHVVHCPKSSAWFGHRRFHLEQLLERNINVCIGTDSLASNDSLDLRAEIRQAAREHPRVPKSDWLKMITVNPARALGQAGRLGEISAGACADLAGFAIEGRDDPYDAVIESRGRPQFLMLGGATLIAE